MKALLLVLATVIVCCAIFEAGLRLFTPYSARRAAERSLIKVPGPDAAENTREVMHYLDSIRQAPGTDRQWFTEDPPPLSNRTPVAAERVALYKDYQSRGLFPDQADYIWNRYYVEGTRCAPTSRLKNFPDNVLAFDPPAPSDHPFFRFLPNTTGVAGLVTNEFGLRGPPLSLSKPLKTVRIAFLGASTTVGFHNFSFSYPERVTYWLNRFAESNHLGVRFEGLNAGREGIDSRDIAAILRDEILPLDPDLAVYNGGANQFPSANVLVSPRIPPRQSVDKNDPIVTHVVPAVFRDHLAIGDLVDRAVNGFNPVGEPRKPPYRLNWPQGVNEQHPNVDDPNLPLKLPQIVKDLDSIRQNLESIGGQLLVSSFEWYASDIVPLSPVRHQHIYEQLNTVFWPLRYSDIARLANFQNHVLRRYAAARLLPFLDLASSLPQDPNLFADALHLTEAGERLKSWIVFERLAPIVRRQIESGQLPRAAGSHTLPPAPSLAAVPISTHCKDPAGPLTRVMSLDTPQVHGTASIEQGSPLKISTPSEQWAYAAELPIRVPNAITGSPFIYIRGRVLNGQVGLGIVDSETNDFRIEKSVAASPDMIDIYVQVIFPQRATSFIIRNAAPGNVRSEMLIQDVALVLSPQSSPR